MAENPEPLNEGELMRTCGQLYPSFAFESLSSILLVIFFSYVLLVLQSAGSLKSPGKAVCRWLASGIASYFSTFWAFASVWSTVRSMPLTARLRWCRKCNTFVCSFTIITALVSITRMLHIGNINGFRYFGYAVTCPIMMVELVVLIGPVVPLYHFTVVFTWAMTFLCLVTGYMASLQKGLVWEGDLFDFDLGSQTLKFWFTLASMALFAVIMLILPYLALLYHCGKCRFESTWLPWQYTRLLGIVAATWVLFPAWWFVSYEGMNILTDTRLNALGFAVLNMTSKGLFTWQMLRIARHEKQKAETAHEQALPASDDTDKASEVLSGTSTNSTYLWLMGSQVATEQSLMVTILKPFDTSCTFEAAKSKVPHSQRYRRNSRDMDDIPGSFKLGEQRNDVSSPVFPVLTQKASQGTPPRSPKETNWNPSLSSLTENQNAPSGQSFQNQILEQLTEFNARLAALEQGGGKQISEELVARKRPWGGFVSNQPGSPQQAKTELSQNPKQYIELSQGVADEQHLGENTNCLSQAALSNLCSSCINRPFKHPAMGCDASKEGKSALSIDDFQTGDEDKPKVDRASISALWEKMFPDLKLTADELKELVPNEPITSESDDKWGPFKDQFLTLADKKKKEEEEKKERIERMAKDPLWVAFFKTGNEDELKVDKASISAVWEQKHPELKLTADELKELALNEPIAADDEDKFAAFKKKFLTLADQRKTQKEEEEKRVQKRLDEMKTNPMPYLTQFYEELAEIGKKTVDDGGLLCKEDELVHQWWESNGKALLTKSFDYHNLKGNGVLDEEEAHIFFDHLMELQSKYIDKMGACIVPFCVKEMWAEKHEEIENAKKQLEEAHLDKMVKKSEKHGFKADREELRRNLSSDKVHQLHAEYAEKIDKGEMDKELKETVEAKYGPKIEELMQKVHATMESYKQNREEVNKKVFAILDVSNHGTLQLDEVLAALNPTGDIQKKMFEALGISEAMVHDVLKDKKDRAAAKMAAVVPVDSDQDEKIVSL